MAVRRVFVAGGHTTAFLGKGNPNFIWKKHPDFGKRENPTLREMLSSALNGALSDARVPCPSLIDRCFVGNFAAELFCQQGHLGAAVAGANPKLMYKPSMRLEGACASGGLAVAAAMDAIKSGSANLALVIGVEQQTTASARDGGLFLARAADFQRQSGIDDFTFPCLLARRTKAYAQKYPSSFEMNDLCHIVAKAYANGNKNPKAHMHSLKIDVEKAKVGEKNPNFLLNPEYTKYLRLTDCSQVSDGASALVLASEEGLSQAGISLDRCAEILVCEHGCGNLYEDPLDLAEMDTTRAVVQRALTQAGKTVRDMQVAEVHDCFSIAELLMYEAIGLAAPRRGSEVAKNGLTALDGELPTNTGGGLMAFGHPVGATGVKQVHEIYRQMKGQCENYQLKSTPELGLTVNMGGDDKTIVSMIIKNH